jgi:hypothetical protein
MLLKDADNSQRVVAPGAGSPPGQVVEVEFEISGKFLGADHQFAIAPWCNCHVDREPNGGGHDKAIVIVGMLTDQVDASRRTKDFGAIAEYFFEMLWEFV